MIRPVDIPFGRKASEKRKRKNQCNNTWKMFTQFPIWYLQHGDDKVWCYFSGIPQIYSEYLSVFITQIQFRNWSNQKPWYYVVCHSYYCFIMVDLWKKNQTMENPLQGGTRRSGLRLRRQRIRIIIIRRRRRSSRRREEEEGEEKAEEIGRSRRRYKKKNSSINHQQQLPLK